MKKLFSIIVLFLSLISISSCKKKIEYHYVGAYVNIMGTTNKSLNDENLKIYYNMNTKVVEDVNHIFEYRLTTESTYKDIELNGDKPHINLSVIYKIIDIADKVKEVEVYPIIYKDGSYIIDDNDVETIKLSYDKTISTSIKKRYEYNKETYEFITTIKILKKES